VRFVVNPNHELFRQALSELLFLQGFASLVPWPVHDNHDRVTTSTDDLLHLAIPRYNATSLIDPKTNASNLLGIILLVVLFRGVQNCVYRIMLPVVNN
jgi:hypothetical protein